MEGNFRRLDGAIGDGRDKMAWPEAMRGSGRSWLRRVKAKPGGLQGVRGCGGLSLDLFSAVVVASRAPGTNRRKRVSSEARRAIAAGWILARRCVNGEMGNFTFRGEATVGIMRVGGWGEIWRLEGRVRDGALRCWGAGEVAGDWTGLAVSYPLHTTEGPPPFLSSSLRHYM